MLRSFYNSIIVIAIFVILTTFITSCGEDDDHADDPTILTTNYAPIEIGNSWTFINVEDPFELDPATIAITDTRQLVDGKTVYFGVFVNDDDVLDRGYMSRAANDLLLFHRSLKDLEGDLVYKPPIRVGAKWQGEESLVEVVAQETVSTPAGVFQNCFRINVHTIGSSEYYTVWLANNVGPVKLVEIDVYDGEETIEKSAVLTSYNITRSVVTDQNPSRF